MSAAQWREVELELGNSDLEGSDYSGSAASSASDGESDQELWSGVKRVSLIGATAALALVGVFALASTPGVLVPAPGAAAPPETFVAAGAESKVAAPREALVLTDSEPEKSMPVPAVANVSAVPSAVTTTTKAPIVQLAENKRRRPVNEKPKEHMHDGNLCDDTEELYDSLCYTKCSILTGLPDARRSTAFSCCPTSDCHGNVFKMKTASLVPCQGYDVSSSDGGKACPHIRGECLLDEEQFEGECFEKCSVLTNGRFPHRIGAASCCDPKGFLGCFNIFQNDDTNAKLNVGGGAGDGDASTPSASHFPLKYLTEQR